MSDDRTKQLDTLSGVRERWAESPIAGRASKLSWAASSTEWLIDRYNHAQDEALDMQREALEFVFQTLPGGLEPS